MSSGRATSGAANGAPTREHWRAHKGAGLQAGLERGGGSFGGRVGLASRNVHQRGCGRLRGGRPTSPPTQRGGRRLVARTAPNKSPARRAGLSWSRLSDGACRSLPEDSKPANSTPSRSIGCTAQPPRGHPEGELAGRAVLTSQRAGGGGTNQLRELGPASTI